MSYSLTAVARAILAETWHRIPSTEYLQSQALCFDAGAPEGNGIRVPDSVLYHRDLVAGTPSAGGYLAPASQAPGYLAALQPASIVLQFGALVISVPASASVAYNKGASAASTTWLSTETSTITNSNPTFGQITGTPKIVAAFTKVSRQLLLQAANAEQVLRTELANAAAVALDTAVLAGTGALGQPLGIVGTPGIGAFTGASLGYTALVNAQTDIATGNAVVNGQSLGYVTTPAIAETLKGRQRFAGVDTPLWQGAIHAGVIEGIRARATSLAPAATCVYGDFSTIIIPQWSGGLVVEIDPFTDFKSGQVGFRLLLPLDVVVSRPTAFSVATSVT